MLVLRVAALTSMRNIIMPTHDHSKKIQTIYTVWYPILQNTQCMCAICACHFKSYVSPYIRCI